MKNIIIIVLLAIFPIALYACAIHVESDFLSHSDLNNEILNTLESGTNIPPISFKKHSIPSISQNPFNATDMPSPFEHEGGDDNDMFYFPHTNKLALVDPISVYFADYLNLSEEEFVDSFLKKFDEKYWEAQDDWMKLANVFSIIIEYDIPNEIVAASLNKYNDYQESFATWSEAEEWLGNAKYFRSRMFTDVEIEALLSRNPVTVLQQYSTEYAIAIGDKAYAPIWLYYKTPDDYKRAGITMEMIEEKLNLYNNLNLSDEAILAFEKKLSAFTGKSVIITKDIEK